MSLTTWHVSLTTSRVSLTTSRVLTTSQHWSAFAHSARHVASRSQSKRPESQSAQSRHTHQQRRRRRPPRAPTAAGNWSALFSTDSHIVQQLWSGVHQCRCEAEHKKPSADQVGRLPDESCYDEGKYFIGDAEQCKGRRTRHIAASPAKVGQREAQHTGKKEDCHG